MKIWQTELTHLTGNYYIENCFSPSSMFFDIETTGFSAAHSQVYMIGYATKINGNIGITQLFAETPSEELEILAAFLEALSQYSTLVSFNGTGFDVPFLKGRYAHYKMAETLDSFQHIDIYKQISGFKHILKLQNLKQKTLESFLGISRDDKYSGGDLIPIYSEYAKHPSQDACALLKLHNFEDMAGMAELLSLLSYPSLLEGNFQISSLKTQKWDTYEGQEGWELILSLETDAPLPKHFSCKKGELYVVGFGHQVNLRVQPYIGGLKYFYPNYKDYYYLPAEDRAIHKSVASYVDKNFRTQAAASTCYCKKSGCFLPQYQTLFTPSLKQEYQDQISYFELTEDFKASGEKLKVYAMHLLNYFL